MTLATLPHALDRVVLIHAPREGVFRYFTDSRRFAAWWGAGSSIDPQPGGAVRIRYPNGVEAAGEVLEIEPPARIVFSYGYASGQPIPVGASRVTVELAEDAAGTRLKLRHEFAAAAARDQHVAGWRYQLAVFANVVADESFAGAAERIDAWLAAWAETDAERRRAAFAALATGGVVFRDRHACVEGLDELTAHVGALQQFFPGARLERAGEVRHCQGTALADWRSRAADGAESGRGTNVFRFAPDGRIASVVGFWTPPAAG
jgi:uncharacterized protein YndB with AHSA1/START domain